ncbi:MAG: UDP-N-acetylmuramoyl-L-alanine--D-glutamate ligase [Oscillospiraceae bacterium]|nr:UDP-N-acetylmuramoyl-L-alanine--D-glutamate ligase [Oscillospiraceae bacterium]
MTLDQYIDSLKSKTVAVIGLGVSNKPLLELLLNAGCRVTVRDKQDREKMGPKADELEARGCTLVLGDEYLSNLTEDVIFRTPGLLPTVPALREAAKRGSQLTSEMEAFFALCPGHIIAVTGSDGKTTTTTVISELLKAQGMRVFLGGNIGTPLLDRVSEMAVSDWIVLELSSFQLHSMACHPRIAVITNVSPNHLDVHDSYEDYQVSKKQIFLAQEKDDVLVLNADNAITASFAAESRGQVRFFSRQTRPENGFYMEDGIIWRSENGTSERFLDADEIRIPGLHNAENFMAAFAAVDGIVSPENCRRVAREFAGVAHRLEKFRTLRGVTYCNDSIASSPTRTIAGLHALDRKPILIAGGYDKHLPFDVLGDEICLHVKELFLTGFTAEKILAAVKASRYYDPSALPVHVIPSFRDAVLAASAAAKEGDMVLLSPACASFDMFKNFEERGNTFKSIVNEL